MAHDLAPRERLLRGRAVELGVPLHARGADAARVERRAQPGDARDHADLRQTRTHCRARGRRSSCSWGDGINLIMRDANGESNGTIQ